MNILVTGGAGYIGSHTLIELLNAGHATIVIDNLSNSSRESLRRVEEMTGKSVVFYEADVRDKTLLTPSSPIIRLTRSFTLQALRP